VLKICFALLQGMMVAITGRGVPLSTRIVVRAVTGFFTPAS
jgi:hypothetical protein